MSFPRYPKYKESGVEWLGEVPDGWVVMAIKWLSPVKRGASPRPIDDPKYFDDEGEFAWVRISDVSACEGVLEETTQKLSELGSSLSVKIKPGDLFISIAGTVGKPCLSAIHACIHDGFVYFPSLDIDPRLLYRIFEAGTCYGGLGKWGTQLNLNTDTIGAIRIAVPPKPEIRQILAFLDRETAKIDALVAEQENLIALLKEKRQAVISHAVTKGLDPTVPMKDSGIEWLGEVPEGWKITRVKHVINFITGWTPPTGDSSSFEGDNLWANISDLGARAIYDTAKRISDEAVAKSRIKPAREGSLLFSFKLSIGLVSFAGRDMYTNEAIATFAPSKDISLDYAYYAFPEFIVRNAAENIYGAKLLNQELIRSAMLVIPQRRDQDSIASFLERETAKLDDLTTEAQHTIDLLKERRSALISAAVTGKIDVRCLSDEVLQ